MKNLIFMAVLSTAFSINAQFVTIPDSNFVTFLQNNYPSCMSGNQMDTTCADIVNELYVYCSNKGIVDLDGIQYFDNLEQLNANDNDLANLPVFPQSSLYHISLYNNQLTTIGMGVLPSNLQYLYVGQNNGLTSIAALPLSLTHFSAQYCTNLTLPNLHAGLLFIDLAACGMSSVPPLPNTVEELQIGANFFGSIPSSSIPSSVKTLNIGNCNLSVLPTLPPNLEVLHCGYNDITVISTLPSSVVSLYANDNSQLTSISNLPDSMEVIRIHDCALTFIDSLPVYCSDEIDLSNNNLTSIPNFPEGLNTLKVNSNNISSIPDLPASLVHFQMINNNVSCWPVFPNLANVFIQGNPHQCIPNYIQAMSMQTYYDTIPICNFNNTSSNPAGCPTGEGIEGNLFEDFILDCHHAGTEAPIKNTQVKVYDVNGTLLETSSTGQSGRYFLSTSNNGTYSVEVDTLNKPFEVSCAAVGADSLVTISSADSLVEDVNFGFVCSSGFDLGVQSVSTDGWVFPGQTHNLQVIAGDLSQWYGLSCAIGTGGNVSITVNGPVSYVNAASNALVPTVSGSTYSYAISDFGNVSIYNSFSLNFQTDTTAQSGDTICVTVIVTPTTGDVNPANNTYSFCYNVLNSYDPNDKQVYPETVEPGYDDWLTYTVRFQNTGTAPAFNIRLEDTLSGLLDYETFEVIGYKHTNHYNLINDRLIVYFPNIMLPDSTSNFQESIGYFQYRIKPISGITEGTDIENTAYIFFDYNDPIVTNTAVTSFEINDLSTGSFETDLNLQLFPNPSDGKLFLKSSSKIKSVMVCNLMGQSIPITVVTIGNLYEIHLDSNVKGLYFVTVATANGTKTKRLVVE
jgi:uncharacterized repeat protein (TIGR01451 family)